VAEQRPELALWYEEHRAVGAQRADELRTRLIGFVACVFATPLLCALLVQGCGDSSIGDVVAGERLLYGGWGAPSWLAWTDALAGASVLGAAAALFAWRRRQLLGPLRAFVRAPDDAPIVQLVDALRAAMKIDVPVAVYVSRYLRTPATSGSGRRARLLLPKRVVDELATAPRAVRAIVAHELGHVLQDDSGLLVLSELIGRSILVVLLPALLVLGAIDLVTGPRLLLLTPFGLAIGAWFLRGIAARAQLARRDSEERADVAAILFADGAELARWLERHAADAAADDTGGIHPPAQLRADRIRVILRAYSTATRAEPGMLRWPARARRRQQLTLGVVAAAVALTALPSARWYFATHVLQAQVQRFIPPPRTAPPTPAEIADEALAELHPVPRAVEPPGARCRNVLPLDVNAGFVDRAFLSLPAARRPRSPDDVDCVARVSCRRHERLANVCYCEGELARWPSNAALDPLPTELGCDARSDEPRAPAGAVSDWLSKEMLAR
jgi:Zn-dependent protease with chaperone function